MRTLGQKARVAVYALRVQHARASSLFNPTLPSVVVRERCPRCGDNRETYRRHAIVHGGPRVRIVKPYRVLRLRCRACDREDHRRQRLKLREPTMPSALPSWYSASHAAQDRLHDGVAWRCQLHGLLTAQYVVILGPVAYCGACVQGDVGQPEHVPLVASPRTGEHNGRRPRPRVYRPRPGSIAAAVLDIIADAGPDGLRHVQIVLAVGRRAKWALEDLAAHRVVRKTPDGAWTTL